jgi:hypothetical protein
LRGIERCISGRAFISERGTAIGSAPQTCVCGSRLTVEQNTKEKLRAVLAQLDQLLLTDISYPSTKDGLVLFRNFFLKSQELVEQAVESGVQSLLLSSCITSNERIIEFMPFLGFFLRSTNVRNNFECFDALAELATLVIGRQAKVVISSEWAFSPLTYPLTLSTLPDFILIGMPATESDNALILPLAGHELGHSAWVNENIEYKYAGIVKQEARKQILTDPAAFKKVYTEYANFTLDDDAVNDDIFIADIITKITSMALSQIEETFCDAVGLFIFGRSFVYAFHYLLAPGVGGQRSPKYPPLSTRAHFMEIYGNINLSTLGFSNFTGEFTENTVILSPRSTFLLQLADRIMSGLAQEVYREAQALVFAKAGSMLPDSAREAEILKMFRAEVPAKGPGALSNILNAGWDYVICERANSVPRSRPLFDWISELIFKTIEVFEYERRINA